MYEGADSLKGRVEMKGWKVGEWMMGEKKEESGRKGMGCERE